MLKPFDEVFLPAVALLLVVSYDRSPGAAAVWAGTDWATVVKTVLADQFVTTPHYGTTYWSVVYTLRSDR